MENKEMHMKNSGIDFANNNYTFDDAVAHLGEMNYSDFSQFIDEFEGGCDGKIEEILAYDDFSVFNVCYRYFYIEHELEDSSDEFFELELIAELNYTTANDIQDTEQLDSLFDNTCCGEQISDCGIRYLWFKAVE